MLQKKTCRKVFVRFWCFGNLARKSFRLALFGCRKRINEVANAGVTFSRPLAVDWPSSSPANEQWGIATRIANRLPILEVSPMDSGLSRLVCEEGTLNNQSISGTNVDISWEILLDMCESSVRVVAKRLSLQPTDRDDCIQEALCAILSRPPANLTSSDMSRWVARIAHNKAVDVIRSRHRNRSSMLTSEMVDRECATTDRSEDSSGEIWQALRELDRIVDKTSAIIFSLRWLEAWSYSEIADELMMSTANARLRNHRVKKVLRNLLIVSDPT